MTNMFYYTGFTKSNDTYLNSSCQYAGCILLFNINTYLWVEPETQLLCQPLSPIMESMTQMAWNETLSSNDISIFIDINHKAQDGSGVWTFYLKQFTVVQAINPVLFWIILNEWFLHVGVPELVCPDGPGL